MTSSPDMPIIDETLPRLSRRRTGLVSAALLGLLGLASSTRDTTAKNVRAEKKGKKGKTGPQGPAGASGARGPQGPAGRLPAFTAELNSAALPVVLDQPAGSSATAGFFCGKPGAVVGGITYLISGDTTTVNIESITLDPIDPRGGIVVAVRTADGGESTITALVTCLTPVSE